MQQKVARVGGDQKFGGPIECIAFADAPQIQLHAGCKNRIVPAAASRLDQVLANRRARRGQGVGVGQSALAADESPNANQRTGRNVVGSVRFAVNALGQRQQGGQARFDLHRLMGSLAVDVADFARFAINRQLRFELFHEIQCRAGRIGLVRRLAGIEKNRKLAGHRPPRKLQQISLGRTRFGRRGHVAPAPSRH